MYHCTRSLCCILLCLTAPPLLATDVDPPAGDAPAAAALEDTLIVLGSRTPEPAGAVAGAVTRFDARDLRDSRMDFAADLLRTDPSAALTRSGAVGGLTQIRMRGAEANHTLVLIDGFEADDPAIGSEYDFAHLRAGTIESAEILPGPSGALWGSDAIGGAIYLRTPRAADGFDWRLAGALGDHDTRSGTLQAGYGGSRGDLELIWDHFASAGTNIARSGPERDGYRSGTLALHGGLELTDRVRIESVLRVLRAAIQFDPTPAPAYLPVDGNQDSRVDRILAGLHLDIAPGDGPLGAFAHRLTLERLGSEYVNRDQGRVTDTRRGDRARLGWQSGLDYRALVPGRQHLTLSMEIEQEGFAQRGAVTPFGDPNQKERLTHRSALAEWRWAAPGDVHLAAVVRRDFNDSFADATHWRLGLRAPLPLGLGDAWTSVSSATKNPTFTERFGYTPDSFTGNPDLRPERGRSVELGWQRGFAGDRVVARLVGYRARLQREIDGFVFDPASGGFTARNRATDSRRRGVEAMLRLTPDAATRLTLRYAFTDASEPDGSGGQVREVRRPRHGGSLTLVRSFASLPLSARMDAVYVGDRADRDFATFPASNVTLGDYVLAGAALNWRLGGGATLFVRADNLLDARYEDVLGYRGPGRAVQLGFELRRD